jgi:hypothetical protein
MGWVIMDPAMSIDPSSGTLYESHNEGGSGWAWNNTGVASFRNTGTLRTGTNAQTAALGAPLLQFTDPIVHSNVYRSPGNGTIAPATWAVTSIIGRSGTSQYWQLLGGIYINGPGGTYFPMQGAGGTDGVPNNDNHYNNPIYYGESTWYNASTQAGATPTDPPSTDQFLNPHIITSYGAVSGNATIYEHIHVSYYDSKDGSIKYRYNRRNAPGTIHPNNTTVPATAATNSAAIPKVWTNLDGGYDAEDRAALTASGAFTAVGGDYRVVNFGGASARTVSAKVNNGYTSYTGIDAGEHNAIAVTSQGYPVVAYYANQKLKLAISGAVNPIDSRNWIIVEDVIPGGNLSHDGTGQFVSIAIDTREGTNTTLNYIHIAAMNTNGNLVYIRGLITPPTPRLTTNEVYTALGGSLTNVTVQVVDSLNTVGRWCNISLDLAGNPWIAYQDTGYIGSRDGVKLAYLNTSRFTKGTVVAAETGNQGQDVDVYGRSISGWETMHVPTRWTVQNPVLGTGEQGRIGLECYPSRNYSRTTPGDKFWSAAVSYLSTDLYRIAYYVE